MTSNNEDSNHNGHQITKNMFKRMCINGGYCYWSGPLKMSRYFINQSLPINEGTYFMMLLMKVLVNDFGMKESVRIIETNFLNQNEQY